MTIRVAPLHFTSKEAIADRLRAEIQALAKLDRRLAKEICESEAADLALLDLSGPELEREAADLIVECAHSLPEGANVVRLSSFKRGL